MCSREGSIIRICDGVAAVEGTHFSTTNLQPNLAPIFEINVQYVFGNTNTCCGSFEDSRNTLVSLVEFHASTITALDFFISRILIIKLSLMYHSFHNNVETQCRFFPGHFSCPVSQIQHISLAQRMFAGAPWHLFDFYPAAMAINAPHAVQ